MSDDPTTLECFQDEAKAFNREEHREVLIEEMRMLGMLDTYEQSMRFVAKALGDEYSKEYVATYCHKLFIDSMKGFMNG